MECFEQIYFGNHAMFSLIYEREIGGQNLFSKRPYAVTIIAVMQIKVGITKAIYKTKYLMENKPKTLKNKKNNSINTL